MKTVGITELRRSLSYYVDLVEEKGEVVRITNRNVVVAKIVPVKKPKKKKK